MRDASASFSLCDVSYTVTLRGFREMDSESMKIIVTVPISHEWKVLSEKTVAVI